MFLKYFIYLYIILNIYSMKESVNLSFDKDLVKKLKKLAEEENRTLSNLVETIIINEFKKKEGKK